MKNNTYVETKADRLARFRANPPHEVVSTLINSIANYFNNEISLTTQENNYQTSLLFLGIHSVALTLTEGLFNKHGPDAYKMFLDKFVDGTTFDTKFSSIAPLIHDWRNVLAHQWLGSVGHVVGYDYEMPLGWELRNGVTFINPAIYLKHYLAAFAMGGKIWDWEKHLSTTQREEAKQRLIGKYLNR